LRYLKISVLFAEVYFIGRFYCTKQYKNMRWVRIIHAPFSVTPLNEHKSQVFWPLFFKNLNTYQMFLVAFPEATRRKRRRRSSHDVVG
jgi:hypothetical protein